MPTITSAGGENKPFAEMGLMPSGWVTSLLAIGRPPGQLGAGLALPFDTLTPFKKSAGQGFVLQSQI